MSKDIMSAEKKSAINSTLPLKDGTAILFIYQRGDSRTLLLERLGSEGHTATTIQYKVSGRPVRHAIYASDMATKCLVDRVEGKDAIEAFRDRELAGYNNILIHLEASPSVVSSLELFMDRFENDAYELVLKIFSTIKFYAREAGVISIVGKQQEEQVRRDKDNVSPCVIL